MIDYSDIEQLRALAANDNDQAGIVRLPHRSALLRQSALYRLALAYNALLPSSRRGLPSVVCDIIWNYNGVVVNSSGAVIRHRDIDPDAILYADNEPTCSWIGSFYKFALRAPQRAPQARLLERLELLWMALAIKHPSVARYVVR